MSCISAQETFSNAASFHEVKTFNEDRIWAVQPNYKEFIPLSLLRRMSRLVKMSVATGIPLHEKNKNIEAIIIASANGSIDHSLRFLNQIINYNEGTLTPTDFVQSTPNCVAGVLALMTKTTGYNTTHVNLGIAFESALLDALLLLEEGKYKRVLLGGGEEQSEATYNIDSQQGLFKKDITASSELLHSKTTGTISGEGFSMFVIDAEKQTNSIAEIKDVDTICHVTKEELGEKAIHFLKKNNLRPENIDAIFVGRNGDSTSDEFYNYLEERFFPKTATYVYKHLVGEYSTVSGFSVWLATQLLSGKKLPNEYVWKKTDKTPKTVLLYNNSLGKQHGFILLKKA